MNRVLTILFLAFALPFALAAKQPQPEPIKFRFSPKARLYVVHHPELQLWSQHEIAQTKWPKVNGWDCKQARVRGVQGDREKRNFIVVRLKDGKIITPQAKYFVRPDPWYHSPPMPTRSAVPANDAQARNLFIGPPAPRSFRMAWDTCPNTPPRSQTTSFRVYRSVNFSTPEFYAATFATSISITCDGDAGKLYSFTVTAFNDGMESAPGGKGCP